MNYSKGIGMYTYNHFMTNNNFFFKKMTLHLQTYIVSVIRTEIPKQQYV